MHRRVVIIGAGPGGLAAAMLLALTGAQVTVLEKRSRVGGRTATLEIGGFRFDAGPTFFLYPRVLEEIFAACGWRLANEVELIRLDPLYRLVFEGGEHLRMYSDHQRLAAELGRLSPPVAQEFPRFLADNNAKLEAFRPILGSSFDGVRDLLTGPVLKALRHLRPHLSLDEDLSRYFSDPRIRLAFSFQSKYLGMSPYRCPSLFSILSFLEHGHGVFHPRGGCGAVTETMARLARAMGVAIRTDEAVRHIRFAERRAVEVRTDRSEYPLDALVINADFAKAMMTLVPDDLRRRWSDSQIARKKFSFSTFMMYLGIEGRVDQLDHHTIYLVGDYARNLAEVEAGRELPQSPSFYVQNACVTDPKQAPAGCSTLYVLVPVGHQSGHVDWLVEKTRFRALVLRSLEKLGIDNLEARIKVERIVTPADWERDFALYRGATFNLAHSLDQMLHRRPHNRFEDLDGVYLVGGGTHPGSGLPVIFESARITARLLANDLGLAAPWPEQAGAEAALPSLERSAS